MNNKKNKLCILSLITIICFGIIGSYFLKTNEKEKINSKTVLAQTIVEETKEIRAVWISFLEFQEAGMEKMSKKQFMTYIDKIFNNCVKLKMNTVIVQVRPFGDAMYSSEYFPWSKIASGKQGRNPGYDPLEYMVESAHAKGLKIEAWINPYRVTLTENSINNLSKNNQAVKWSKSKDSSLRRNVLHFDGKFYYNPAKEEVHELIVNGVKEIVQNYHVDGIHFDDYFYPTLGPKYKNNFDAKEYKIYNKKCKNKGIKPMSIIKWRRNNVDILVSKVYSAIKEINSDVTFGISPAGNLNNLYAKDRYYSDVKKWMNKTGYIDYICPQIYWSFTNKICPYSATVKKWAKLKKNEEVDLYIGIAAYRAGISKKEAMQIGDKGWAGSNTQLKRQVLDARKNAKISGFAFYRYNYMIGKKAKKEIKNLKEVFENE